MKKKIFGGMAVVVIAIAMAFNVNLNMSKSNNASLLALANVEALASGESGLCPNGCMGPGTGCYCNAWYPFYHEGSL